MNITNLTDIFKGMSLRLIKINEHRPEESIWSSLKSLYESPKRSLTYFFDLCSSEAC